MPLSNDSWLQEYHRAKAMLNSGAYNNPAAQGSIEEAGKRHGIAVPEHSKDYGDSPDRSLPERQKQALGAVVEKLRAENPDAADEDDRKKSPLDIEFSKMKMASDKQKREQDLIDIASPL